MIMRTPWSFDVVNLGRWKLRTAVAQCRCLSRSRLSASTEGCCLETRSGAAAPMLPVPLDGVLTTIDTTHQYLQARYLFKAGRCTFENSCRIAKAGAVARQPATGKVDTTQHLRKLPTERHSRFMSSTHKLEGLNLCLLPGRRYQGVANQLEHLSFVLLAGLLDGLLAGGDDQQTGLG